MKNPLRKLLSSSNNKKKHPIDEELKPGTTEDSATAAAASPQHHPHDNSTEEEEVLDAVIIGAGWSGLGAGMTFLEKAKKKTNFQFCILEGHSDIGGRSRTLSPLSEEYPESMLELGSQWIHGVQYRKNKIYQLARKHNLMLHYDRGTDDWNTGRAAVWWDRLLVSENDKKTTMNDSNNNKNIQIERLSDKAADKLEHELLRGSAGFYHFLYRYPALHKRRWKQQQQTGTRGTKPPSVSVGHVMEEYCQLKKLSPQSKQFLKWMVEVDLTQEYAASLEDIDAEWWDHDKEYSGGDAHFGCSTQTADRGSVPGGYSALIQQYAAPLLMDAADKLIRCNCVVTSIDYTCDPMVVEYVERDPSSTSTSTILRRIRARSVLCTVPLGVLKAESIRFTPQLPPSKLNSIQRLGVGTYNKVVLLWKPDQRPLLPWLFPLDQSRRGRNARSNNKKGNTRETSKPTDRIWMECIHLPGQPQGPWTQCYNAHTHHTETSPVLLYFFLAGRMADQVETFTDQEIQTRAMAALREWFGKPNDDIPDPQQVILTRWKSDDLAKGAYSFYQVGSSPDDRKALAKPVDNRLFFAGEANHLKYFATTHGALMTGQTTAKQMWKEHLKRQRS